MGLVGAIASLSTGTYTITRTAAGTLVEGKHVDGASSTFSAVSVVVPNAGQVAIKPPEGIRIEDTRLVYTTEQLRAVGDGIDRDEVGINEQTNAPGAGRFVVVSVMPYPAFGDNFVVAVAARQP